MGMWRSRFDGPVILAGRWMMLQPGALVELSDAEAAAALGTRTVEPVDDDRPPVETPERKRGKRSTRSTRSRRDV